MHDAQPSIQKNDELEELKGFLGRIYDQMNDKESNSIGLTDSEEPIETFLEDLKAIVKRGRRLVWFCTTFGTGSLFWLHGLFTDNL